MINLEALGLAFGVAMDAAAVAAARGLAHQAPPRDGLILALLFGLFQAAMAAIGYGLAHVGGDWFASIDHWVAFVTLVLIGIKMLREAREQGEEPVEVRTTPRVYLALSIATSIDAAAVGMSLPMVPTDPWLAIALMGGVTLVCVLIAYGIARRLSKQIGGAAELLGGLVLIAIGIRVLVEHLTS